MLDVTFYGSKIPPLSIEETEEEPPSTTESQNSSTSTLATPVFTVTNKKIRVLMKASLAAAASGREDKEWTKEARVLTQKELTCTLSRPWSGKDFQYFLKNG